MPQGHEAMAAPSMSPREKATGHAATIGNRVKAMTLLLKVPNEQKVLEERQKATKSRHGKYSSNVLDPADVLPFSLLRAKIDLYFVEEAQALEALHGVEEL